MNIYLCGHMVSFPSGKYVEVGKYAGSYGNSAFILSTIATLFTFPSIMSPTYFG